MAELNFGLLTPPGSQSIGNAFVSGMDQAQAARLQEQQLQQSMQQNALAKAKMGEYQRGIAEQNALRNRMTQPGFDINNPQHQQELLGIAPVLGQTVLQHAATMAKTGAETARFGALTEEARVKAVQAKRAFRDQGLRDMANNPSDANIIANHEDAVLQKMMTPEESAKQIDTLLKIPLANRKAIFERAGAPAAAPQQPRQTNMATDLLIPGPNGTMVPNQALINVKRDLRPEGTTVNVKLPAIEGEYGKTFAKNTAEDDIKMLGAARNAPKVAATANRVTELLNKPDIFVGPAATVKLNVARALSILGADETESMRNTEKLIAAAGQGTLDAIKDAGLGTGQGFTAKDLEFLTNVAGGKIDFTAENLRTMSRLQYRAAELSVKKFTTRRGNMPESATKGTGIDKETYDLPPRIGGPTPEAITYLKANPSTKAAFDKRYGDGEAEHTLRMGK